MFLAYLDPAAGGMIIQSLIAAAVAIPFILRSQISRGLAKLRGTEPDASEDKTPETND
jgi:hypothetical protein